MQITQNFTPTAVTRKTLKVCTHLTETYYVFCDSYGRCQNDNPTCPKLYAVFLMTEAMQLRFAASTMAKIAAYKDIWLGGST